MHSKWSKISQTPLVRNSAKLLSANVFAQAIGLAVYPILTRLYAPEDFGAFNVFLSIAGIATLVSTAEFQAPCEPIRIITMIQTYVLIFALRYAVNLRKIIDLCK